MKTVKQIPGAMTVVDLATGKETHEPMAWTMLPPAADKCQVCARKHEPRLLRSKPTSRPRWTHPITSGRGRACSIAASIPSWSPRFSVPRMRCRRKRDGRPCGNARSARNHEAGSLTRPVPIADRPKG
jgi:hypothetical protein